MAEHDSNRRSPEGKACTFRASVDRGAAIARIERGHADTSAVFPLRRLSLAGAVVDPLGALLFAGSDPIASLTVVNGRIRVRAGQMIGVDEARALDGANAAATRLLEAARRRTGIDFARQA
jgi:hypothetical protein